MLSFLPKEDQYFDLFTQMTLYISSAARELKEMLADKHRDYKEYAQRIKGLEHACDELTHTISTRLNKSFITPFDREDIYMMSTALDDIVDLIDDAARAIIIFDIQEITDYARDFADVLERMAEQLKEIVSTLQRPKNVTQRLVEIHRLENEGDDIYHAAKHPQIVSSKMGRRRTNRLGLDPDNPCRRIRRRCFLLDRRGNPPPVELSVCVGSP